MCGICGYIGFEDQNMIYKMCDLIYHRGPDSDGFYFDKNLALGNRRLSIIDLERGKQPIHNEDETIWIVYNGEIYNYSELRENLIKKGHNFYTNTDTETIIHLYEEDHVNFINKLNGMFAFALWDKKRGVLILARDPFGIKPLHYIKIGDKLIFGSEIKSMLIFGFIERKVDIQSLHYMLNLRYMPGEGTLFKGIKRLLPGHMILYKNGKIDITRYYDITNVEINHNLTESDWIDGINHHFRGAVKRHLISDVPIGVYLSGGMDSSSIVAYMRELSVDNIKTFSMGFNEPTDELNDAKMIAKFFNTEHHEISVDPEPISYLPEIIYYMEEPKVNQLQGFLLSRFTREYVKVILTGMGGDELFGGYINNRYIHYGSLLNNIVPNLLGPLFNEIDNIIFSVQNKSKMLVSDEYRRGAQLLLSTNDWSRYYSILRNVWDGNDGNFQNIYNNNFNWNQLLKTEDYFRSFLNQKEMTFLENTLLAEFQTKMVDDFLVNEDRTSMANSIEARVPFLDKELVEFSLSIPGKFKLKGNRLKYIFKETMRKKLPEKTIKKKKWGFAFNPYYQFQKDLKTTAEKILTKKRIEQQGIFNYDYLKMIMDHKPHPRLRWHYFYLWMVVGFQIWHIMYIDRYNSNNHEFSLESYYE
ncbi:MAG: asparagine synthase (glutamine-hydrolyzing) [Nitrospirota bacterium]